MWIRNERQTTIINSDYVQRFFISDKGDAHVVMALSGTVSPDNPPVSAGSYKTKKEAQDALLALLVALGENMIYFDMPPSLLTSEQEIIKDARVRRKGGS